MLVTISAMMSVIWLLAIAAKLKPAHQKIRARKGK